MPTHPDADDRRLADVGEDELLAAIVPLFDPPAGTLLGPGDDTAVIAAPDGRVVATTDTMVRGPDWRDDWSDAQDVGAKIVAQNVADVAAMGAVPTGLLLTLVAGPFYAYTNNAAAALLDGAYARAVIGEVVP